MAKTTLYICYFGLTEPLVQTQVLPYLRELVKGEIQVSLLTFEPEFEARWPGSKRSEMTEELKSEGIEWHALGYHKWPSALATAYDIFQGVLTVRRLINAKQIDILHGRIHVATLIGAIARKLSGRKPRLIFDIRGFFPEEYVDAGVWNENGMLFRGAKRIEKWLMKEADGFVVLTEKARSMLWPDGSAKPVEVIPCCVDFLARFPDTVPALRDEMRESLRVQGRTVYTHIGALGGLYLSREMADLLTVAREFDPRAFALFLTQSDPAEIIGLLKERGFKESDFFVGRVGPGDIPKYLAAADVGLSLVKATYATQSRSPTKIPEYLASGLPIIANSGVGDVDELIFSENVGVLFDSFDRESYQNAIFQLRRFRIDLGQRCREVALRRFDLEKVGGHRYRRLYEQLLCDASDG